MKELHIAQENIPCLDEQLAYLSNARDEDIDFFDIPEITDFSGAVRGKFYRVAQNKPNMSIDVDTLAWFKGHFLHYQAVINGILRKYIVSQS